MLASKVASVEALLRQFLDGFSSAPGAAREANPQELIQRSGPTRSLNNEVLATDGHRSSSRFHGSISAVNNDTTEMRRAQPLKMQELLAAVEADMRQPSTDSVASDGDVGDENEAGDEEDGDEEDQQEANGPGPTSESSTDRDTHQDEQTIAAEAGQRNDGTSKSEDSFYADGLGELDVDSHGQLRYIGLGSTAPVAVENCIGLRLFITQTLKEKGFESEDIFLGSPEAHRIKAQQSDEIPPELALPSVLLPPAELVHVLLATYKHHLGDLLPIVGESDIRRRYDNLAASPETCDAANVAVVFAALAVATPLVDFEDEAFGELDTRWRTDDNGAAFYQQAMEFVDSPMSSTGGATKARSLDMVITLSLLSVYHAETSSQAEAWIMVGRAIRIAQDIGLHRSPKRLRLPREDWDQRRNIWWCLYIIERQLCTALGRPLSINDDDCDTEIPLWDDDGDKIEANGRNLSAFVSMIHLHQITGKILRIVNSPGCASLWDGTADDSKKEELRSQVTLANEALRTWARDKVPEHIKTASAEQQGPAFAEKQVILSSFFSAVMLLYRAFMRNPHRPSLLAGSQAQLRSAKAATDCIRGAPEFFRCVPRGHMAIFHGQYVLVSALVLLSCVRWSDDPKFVYSTLKDVEQAMDILQGLGGFWSGAHKCRASVAEYLEFTFRVLKGDRTCHFQCSHHHPRGKPSSLSSPAKRSVGQTGVGTGRSIRSAKRRRHGQITSPQRPSPSSPSLAPQPVDREVNVPTQSLHEQQSHQCENQQQQPREANRRLESVSASPGSAGRMLISTGGAVEPSLAQLQDITGQQAYFDGGIEHLLGALHPNFVMLEQQLGESPDGTCIDPAMGAFLQPDSTDEFLQGPFFY
ncbi:fungal-specific transcription factor domain-containing protein [Microdochium trichocladiopsis]|uniref:Fungal-specific transcription factor domain-containing protein n=1 Tax=Microdochium trichocladiopsis TaxID=1682393 RepID=A0A9P8Y629_9PEZI|nr:fungal-specific transcription factor domain-containing protein [Microdochium trichocladiopsis]KAH7028762.1 fungal-specific transcription factor domain-containing protein [Microdochium trichocladiopsis]